jgi:hypothetical protein
VKTERRERPDLARERRAPYRPVITHRVSQEIYDLTFQAAKRANRKLTEEAGFRLEQSFVWEQAHVEAQMLAESAKRDLETRLKEAGYKYVRGAAGGGAWFPPGVDPVTWIFDNSNRDLIEELMRRAASRALTLARMEATDAADSASFTVIRSSVRRSPREP